MRRDKTTGALERILKGTSPDRISSFLESQKDELAGGRHPFADYMREVLREKGITQQELFLKADIPESYGYKLISEEKHTRQRDVILRMCIAGGFTLREAQRALKLTGLTPLYARVARDAVVIIALNRGIREIADVDHLLTGHGMDALRGCGEN